MNFLRMEHTHCQPSVSTSESAEQPPLDAHEATRIHQPLAPHLDHDPPAVPGSPA